MQNKSRPYFLTFSLVLMLQSAAYSQQSYEDWDAALKESWKNSGVKTFLDKARDLSLSIEIRRDWIKNGEFKDLNIRQEIIFYVNKMQTLLNGSISKTYDEIDWKWLKEVNLAINYVRAAKFNLWDLSTFAQSELVKQANEILGLEKELSVFSEANGGSASIPSGIAVCENPDLDMRLFGIYHELGHMTNRDFETNPDKADQEVLYLKLHERAFSSDLKRIDELLELAQTSLPTKTNLGLKLQEDLESNGSFWLPPPKIHDRRKMMLWRGQEKRADLFALTKLYEQGKIGTIIAKIHDFGVSDYVTVIGKADVHPSNVERSLYMLGFLISKNVNVSALLQDYEMKGSCVNSEALFKQPMNRNPVKSGFYEFLEKYQIWRESAEGYSHWKEALKKELSAFESPPIDRIKSDFSMKILGQIGNKNLTENKRLRSDLLYYYNYLRESYGMPIVHDLHDIDRWWLYDTSYAIWKHLRHPNDNDIDVDLIDLRIKYGMLQEGICVTDVCRMGFLHLYNFIRAHFRKPKTLTLDKIDKDWIASVTR